MDWTNTAHIAQALYWTLLFGLFVSGYAIGSRGIV